MHLTHYVKTATQAFYTMWSIFKILYDMAKGSVETGLVISGKCKYLMF